MGLALTDVPRMRVGDESEAATLLNSMTYLWFWISPNSWTRAGAIGVEVRASEGGLFWHRDLLRHGLCTCAPVRGAGTHIAKVEKSK